MYPTPPAALSPKNSKNWVEKEEWGKCNPNSLKYYLIFPITRHNCHAQSPSPQNWENKMSRAMQKHKGVLLPARARAPVSSSAVESWQEPQAQIYSSIYKFRTKTGSWQGLIGCRGFLVFTDWPVISPLIGQSYHLSDWPELPSLWLARVTISLIGQSYHPQKPWKHDSEIIFVLVYLSEPVMALVRL